MASDAWALIHASAPPEEGAHFGGIANHVPSRGWSAAGNMYSGFPGMRLWCATNRPLTVVPRPLEEW